MRSVILRKQVLLKQKNALYAYDGGKIIMHDCANQTNPRQI